MLIIGPRHLRAVLDRYAVHYKLPSPAPGQESAATRLQRDLPAEYSDLTAARIWRRTVLGGLINEYERAA